MTPLCHIEGIAAPLPIDNLDTDQIMPKQFLRVVDKAGLAAGLLWDLRFDGDGQPRPQFVLNRPAYADTRVLIAGTNFGCGSSREHAVWGLMQRGIQAVVAPSFGEIFHSNATNNGLLTLQLPPADAQALMAEALRSEPPMALHIDLDTQQLRSPQRQIHFELAPRQRAMLMQGLDMVAATLQHEAAIAAWAERHARDFPWLHDIGRRTRDRLDSAQASSKGSTA